jgi:hypothetical protein
MPRRGRHPISWRRLTSPGTQCLLPTVFFSIEVNLSLEGVKQKHRNYRSPCNTPIPRRHCFLTYHRLPLPPGSETAHHHGFREEINRHHRRRHHWLVHSLLLDPSSTIRPLEAQHSFDRSHRHRIRCIRQGRRPACSMGIPSVNCPSQLPPPPRARRRTRRQRPMGL